LVIFASTRASGSTLLLVGTEQKEAKQPFHDIQAQALLSGLDCSSRVLIIGALKVIFFGEHLFTVMIHAYV
jgi:hypothetical protein